MHAWLPNGHAGSGVGTPFVFEWERGNGVVWTTAPTGWVGRSSPQLVADSTGYWVMANRLPEGSFDDSAPPTGLSLVHIGLDGAPGGMWDSPLDNGYYFGTTAAVRDDHLLVAWHGSHWDSEGEARLTLARVDTEPVTTTIAPRGYRPDAIVAFGEGYVLNLSGRLVRLDATGAPVAWPAPP